MTFSVVIPSYKARFLSRAVASVIAQTVSAWELIVVDDASPEDLKAILDRFPEDSRIRYYRNEKNIGAVNLVDNWNLCLEYCSGDYVICMGDDDELAPCCLENLSALMEKYPGLGVYHSRTAVIDEEGREIEVLESRPEFESSLAMLWGRWSGRRQFIGDFCFKLELLKRNGGFFKLPLAWFSDEISEYIAARGDGVAIPDGVANTSEPGFRYRINQSSISKGTSYTEKVAAACAAADWFRDHLESLPEADGEEGKYRKLIKENLDSRFHEYFRQYVRQDAAADYSRLFYWVWHHADARLGVWEAMLQGLKGIFK